MADSTMERTVPFAVDGEMYYTWYKVFGDLSDGTHRPLVVLHGGPGLSHDYLLPISDLASTQHGPRPVIFYDQLGCARSTHLPNKPYSFWTVGLFVDELVNLLRHLSIENDFDVLGHSWGGMLGAELAVERQPKGMKHLILSNSLASMELWGRSNAQLAEKFSQEVQDGLHVGMADPDKYRAALQVYHAVHGCTVKPVPREVAYSLQQTFDDPTVAERMFGGVLPTWSIVNRLHSIRIPVLVVNGAEDMAQDLVVEPFFWRIDKVKWVTFGKSSHMPFWEERERYMQLVADFMTSKA
ncbi:proline iminopeptidase, partial [Artomyces pyxidatus]